MHTDMQTAAIALRVFLGALVLLLAFRYALVPTLTENFRQRLFCIRRQLFVFMADGNIPPNHPAYVDIRTTINGLLQEAEQITFAQGFVSWILFRKQVPAYQARIARHLISIESDEVRAKIQAFRTDLGMAVGLHVVVTSPLAMAGACVAALIILCMVALVILFDGVRHLGKRLARIQRSILLPLISIEVGAHNRGHSAVTVA